MNVFDAFIEYFTLKIIKFINSTNLFTVKNVSIVVWWAIYKQLFLDFRLERQMFIIGRLSWYWKAAKLNLTKEINHGDQKKNELGENNENSKLAQINLR